MLQSADPHPKPRSIILLADILSPRTGIPEAVIVRVLVSALPPPRFSMTRNGRHFHQWLRLGRMVAVVQKASLLALVLFLLVVVVIVADSTLFRLLLLLVAIHSMPATTCTICCCSCRRKGHSAQPPAQQV